MAKPDDRSDNVEKLQRNIQNTIENFREAEEYLQEHADELSPEEKERIERKNRRRLRSIEGNRREVKEEARYKENGED